MQGQIKSRERVTEHGEVVFLDSDKDFRPVRQAVASQQASYLPVSVHLLPRVAATMIKAMTSADAIRLILDDQERSQRSLAIDLGLTPQALDQRLRSKTMKVSTLCETAERLGYIVALVPSGSSPTDVIRIGG